MLCLLFSCQTRNRVKAFLPGIKLFLVSSTEVQALYNELAAIIIIIDLPVCDVGNASSIDIVFNRVVNIKATNFNVACIGRINNKSDIRFADGNEGAGALVFLEEAVLHQVIMHTNLGNGELAQIIILVFDAVLEGEAQQNEPRSTFL